MVDAEKERCPFLVEYFSFTKFMLVIFYQQHWYYVQIINIIQQCKFSYLLFKFLQQYLLRREGGSRAKKMIFLLVKTSYRAIFLVSKIGSFFFQLAAVFILRTENFDNYPLHFRYSNTQLLLTLQLKELCYFNAIKYHTL